MMKNKGTVVVTGSARRLGREIALALARDSYSLVIHSTRESDDSRNTLADIRSMGVKVKHIAADFNDSQKAVGIFNDLFDSDSSIIALINNAAIFDGGGFLKSDLEEWQRNMAVNLTTPYLLSLRFAQALEGRHGRIINMLDWRALRPGKDHFAYTISKAALASMTEAMALALAPDITVNGLALGAILPPADEKNSMASTDSANDQTTNGQTANDPTAKDQIKLNSIIKPVPAGRWAEIKEVTDTVKFLLSGPAYITGEIIHIDGGRHLV